MKRWEYLRTWDWNNVNLSAKEGWRVIAVYKVKGEEHIEILMERRVQKKREL